MKLEMLENDGSLQNVYSLCNVGNKKKTVHLFQTYLVWSAFTEIKR